MKTVVLSNHTIGITENDMVEIGDSITAYLQDENGMPISVDGEVEDILDLHLMYIPNAINTLKNLKAAYF